MPAVYVSCLYFLLCWTVVWHLLLLLKIAFISGCLSSINNCLMALYLGQPKWACIRTLRNIINPIYLPHCSQIPHSTFPPRPPSLLLGSNTKENRVKQLKHEEGQEPTLLYTRLIVDLVRLLVNCRSPLTHASYCMTTSRPAAATQTKARISSAMHPDVFLRWMPFLPQPSISGFADWLRICWLVYHDVRLCIWWYECIDVVE